MGKSSAPSPDPNIGIAALRSAELGEDYLDWAKGQSAISNAWAQDDRDRYVSTFQPLEDAFVAEAQAYDTPEARATAAREAVSDVRMQSAQAQDASERNMARMGVDPRSGRATDARSRLALSTGLAAAGAANTARRGVEERGRSLRAAAVDLGGGMAVNPATSLGLAGNTMSSGYSAAMNGQRQKGALLGQQYDQQMSSWQADQAQSGQLFGALGNVAGMMIMSSKDAKTDKKPVSRSMVKQLRKMPVEDWTYKEGMGDGGRHTGPYAEDFQAATGKGDGRTIPVIDAIGTTMGAVKELDAKIERMAKQLPQMMKEAA